MSSPVSPSSPSAPPPRPGLPHKSPAWVYVLAVVFVVALLVSPRFRAFVFDDSRAEGPPTVSGVAPSPASPHSQAAPGELTGTETPSADRADSTTEAEAPSAPVTEPRRTPPSGPLSKFQKADAPRTAPGEPKPPRAASDKPFVVPAAPDSSKNGKTASEAPVAGPKLGELTEIRKGVLRSTAGLIYGRGSVDGHRLDHVMEHARDNKEKPVHGVFLGTREEILAVIDEAYQIAQKRGPPIVQKEVERDRTIYLVDMKRKIGYLGGQVGDRKNHPPCRLLQLVLEENDVITAFPTDR